MHEKAPSSIARELESVDVHTGR